MLASDVQSQDFGPHKWNAPSTSMLRLIVLPEEHDGREVMVQGVLGLTTDLDALCFSQEALRTYSLRDCIELEYDESAMDVTRDELLKFHGRFALVEGLFSAFERPRERVVDVVEGEVIRTIDDDSGGYGGHLRIWRLLILSDLEAERGVEAKSRKGGDPLQ